MIEIQMTGICEDCDKAELYLWDSDQSVFTHNWHVRCKKEDACKRVEMLCKSKAEEAEEKKRGKSFRFGGFMHDYDATCKDFDQHECYNCHKPFGDDEKPYCRAIRVVGGVRFGIICRDCAYSFGDGVIERNGKTYYKPDDYEGEI